VVPQDLRDGRIGLLRVAATGREECDRLCMGCSADVDARLEAALARRRRRDRGAGARRGGRLRQQRTEFVIWDCFFSGGNRSGGLQQINSYKSPLAAHLAIDGGLHPHTLLPLLG
jgi:hypothetical protein